MKRFFTFLKTELKLSVRDMNMVIFAIIMPLVIFIIIVSFFPLTQGLTMMKNTFLGISTESILLPICVMVGVTVLCTTLAICFFRWE